MQCICKQTIVDKYETTLTILGMVLNVSLLLKIKSTLAWQVVCSMVATVDRCIPLLVRCVNFCFRVFILCKC